MLTGYLVMAYKSERRNYLNYSYREGGTDAEMNY